MMELISRPRAVSKYKLCWVTNSWSVKKNQVSHERYNRDCNKVSSRFNLVICRHRVYGQLIILWPWQLLCHARGQVAILCTCRDPFGTNLNWNLWRIDCDKIDAYGLVLSSFQVNLTSILLTWWRVMKILKTISKYHSALIWNKKTGASAFMSFVQKNNEPWLTKLYFIVENWKRENNNINFPITQKLVLVVIK